MTATEQRCSLPEGNGSALHWSCLGELILVCQRDSRIEKAWDTHATPPDEQPQASVSRSIQSLCEPARGDHQHDEKPRAGGEQLRRAGKEVLREVHVQSAKHRASDRSEAADDNHGKDLETELRTEAAERNAADREHVQSACQSGERTRKCECNELHAHGRDRLS